MHQTLQSKLAPSLALTPKLQQAIRLLSLSSQELSTEIVTQLEKNPLLEIDEPWLGEGEIETLSSGLPAKQGNESDWVDALGAVTESLRDHLLWQMTTGSFSSKERIIGELLIDHIDDRGYLDTSLEEIGIALSQMAPNIDISFIEIKATLTKVQQFDPSGIGARDLRECLLLQLAERSPSTPGWITAQRLILYHLETLEQFNGASFARKVDVSDKNLRHAIKLIRQLHPHPAGPLSGPPTDYVVPDLFARKLNDRWIVELNESLIPKLRINTYYSGLIERGNHSGDMQYLREHLQQARWFVKNLHHRTETLLDVGLAIVTLQSEFLNRGDAYMRPLILREVAETLNVHESTVSRITTRKYLNTPRGIFELKHFFSSQIGGEDGEVYSAIAIQARIRSLVDGESSQNPLSDIDLCKLLNAEGKNIARRTVAKYRKLLKIPSSNERRRGS